MRIPFLCATLLIGIVFVTGAAAGRMSAQTASHRIILESPTVKPGQAVPRQHTSQGADTSPALTWRDLPLNTKQIVVALEDGDTHAGEVPFLQWMVYGIPAAAKGLPQGLPSGEVLQEPGDLQGAFQARTRFDVTEYRGPQPPLGELHHYRFVVYALDDKLVLEQGLFANRVLDAIKGHIIGEGAIAATYKQTP
jgi:Raf kinase inhibitor-like YbhB/YbcL family protein